MTNTLLRTLLRAALLAVTVSALPALAGADTYFLGNGSDGAYGAGFNSVINAYARVTSAVPAGATQIPINAVTGSGSFGGDDLVLVIQTTGISPEPPSGSAGPIDLSNNMVGRWELARLASGTSTLLTLREPLLYSYASPGTQVVRVPEFTSVSIGPTRSIIAQQWTPLTNTGGIVAFLATGTVTNDGSISATNRGFGNPQSVVDNTGAVGCTGLDEPAPRGGQKGNGIAPGRFGTNQTGRGRVTNGGAGGVCLSSGGGGGGNYGAGGQGGNSDLLLDGSRPVGGEGGTALLYSLVNHMTPGGSGGTGHAANSLGQPGGRGGGIIFFRATNLTGGGSIVSNGINAAAAGTTGGSGGGAGGSIHMRFAGNANCVALEAMGGNGSSTNAEAGGTFVGPGGGGGGGRILIQACGGTCTPVENSVRGGNAGTHPDPGFPDEGNPYGAEPGGPGLIETIPGCYTSLPIPTVVTPAHNSSTNDTTPIYSGTLDPSAQAGTQVIIYVDGAEVARVTPDASGNWSFTPTTPLASGSHTIYAVAINTGLGLQSPPSPTNNFTVDLIAPPAPVVLTPANGVTISDNTPTYSGTAEADSTVTILVDGSVLTTVTATAGGTWSFTPTVALPNGPHTVMARASDAAGNTSPDSNTNTFTVDVSPPSAPVVLTPANGVTINDSTPTYSGTAEAGSTVTIIVDGNVLTTVVATGGTWSFTPTTVIPDGPHTVLARATDSVGNTGPDSATNNFIVDTTPPPAPVVITPANGSTTGDNTPTYSGTAEVGSTVTIIVDGAVVTTVVATDGTWSFSPTTQLADGLHMVRARAADALGNTSVDSNTNTFFVDTTPPAPPVVLTPANGTTTSDNTPTYSGTAEAGSTVSIIVDGAVLTTVVATGGTWSFTPTTPLADGSHTVVARAADTVGNISPDSNTNTFIVDTTAPSAPVVLTPANGATINDNTPTYSGTAEAGSTVTIIVDGSVLTTVVATGGTWSFTPTTPLADGPHTVLARATDTLGNTGPDSNTNTFTVDTTPPAAPVVLTPANGVTISDNTPTYSGTAELGSLVTIYVDGTAVTTVVAADGTWSFTPTVALADGPHAVRARAEDAVGNTSVDSATNNFIVDTLAPAAPVVLTPANGVTISDNTPTYSGTAEAGSTVTLVVDGSVLTTVVATDGTWSFTPTTPLADGPHTVLARATDALGNTGPDSATNGFTVDTTAPAAPVVLTPANGVTISDNTPTYSGTAEAGSTVTLVVDGSVLTTVVATDGTWSFTPTTPLADGPHTVLAQATDAVGNISADSATHTFTVDTTAPAAPVVLTPADGTTTSDNTPTYSGTAELGSLVTIYVDGTAVTTVTATDGTWSFTPTVALADGPHTVRARAADAVGNTSLDSATNGFTVDTLAPAAPVVLTPANGVTISDNTPTYSGTAEVGSTVTLVVDGSVLTTVVATDGTWSFTPTAALADGPHTVLARATDALGNTGPDSATNGFTVDTTAPAAPAVLTPADGVTISDNTPTYSGTAEAGSTVTIVVDGNVLTTVVATGGTWSFTPTTPLADGPHSVLARAADAVGNTSADSATHTFTVDTTAPAAPVVLTPADGETIGDNTPTYSGTAEPNSTVTLIVDGVEVGTTPASAAGTWSFTPTTGLANGTHTVRAHARDAVGNTGPDSATNTFIVDATIPAAPVVLTPANDSLTNNNTPVITGTSEPNLTVTVFLDGAALGITQSDASGNWTFALATPLADGAHEVSAVATNAGGNVSPSSNVNRFTVDTVAPAAPVVTQPVGGTVTSDNTPAIAGTTEPGSTVTLTLNGTEVGPVTVDAAGNWTFTPTTPLADGPYTLVATATDAAGNTSAPSQSVAFIIDTAAPDTTIVTGPSGDTVEPDARFDFSSTEAEVTYECSLDGATFTACADPVTFEDLALGEHTLQVRAKDRAGNVDATPATAAWNVLPPPVDRAIIGGGVGCTTTGSTPSSLAMVGLAVLSALLARRRRE
ncbi:adventurous gliding motility protein AgmC [Hyalangium rubrum]|uniref:Ig-like domain-containing protein n=1 Tax=Hyalangium rubrum TaxID=3103134 RepID=A0ABU5H7I1_9BACT|nr:Ig-like domain-containing protein [Hyalangium sp. s54d21]MDY7228839.1 Ig-like domain-containing protein [Hyalangium sp. s54d21]